MNTLQPAYSPNISSKITAWLLAIMLLVPAGLEAFQCLDGSCLPSSGYAAQAENPGDANCCHSSENHTHQDSQTHCGNAEICACSLVPAQTAGVISFQQILFAGVHTASKKAILWPAVQNNPLPKNTEHPHKTRTPPLWLMYDTLLT